MKRYITLLTIITAFLSTALPAFAQVGTNVQPVTINKTLAISGEPAGGNGGGVGAKNRMFTMISGTPIGGSRQTNLQARASKELTRRLDSLQGLVQKISDIKHLSSDQKTSLTTQVQNEITNLTNLQTKIKADTDTATLKADVQSIVQDYRVYAVFMPQTKILISADKFEDITDNLSIIVTKLQTRLSQVPPSTDIADAQNALTDMQTKLSDAKTQEQNAINTVIGLTLAGYPGNKTSLQSARTMLQNARQDISIMLEDMSLIRSTLMKLENITSVQPTTVTPLLSPGVTETPSLTPSPSI